MKILFSILSIVILLSRYSSGRVVETTGYELNYYARLDENLVHSLSVKRIWSSTRQDILDRKARSKRSDIAEGYIDEHDPSEKKNGLLELANQFSVMAAKEVFKEAFRKFPREDQKWIMEEKKAGAFTDLKPKCYIDYKVAHEPIKCNVDFHSLQLVYATYFDLQVELSTKEMNLTQQEKEERMQPSIKGTTKPIESSNIKMEGKVVTPSRFTRRMKGHDIPLSIDILKHLERKCNRFLATPLPIVKIEEIDSNDISVMHRDIWKAMYDEYMSEDESDEKKVPSNLATGLRKATGISIPVDMDEIMKSNENEADVEEEEVTETQEQQDGVEGLKDFMGAIEEECFDAF